MSQAQWLSSIAYETIQSSREVKTNYGSEIERVLVYNSIDDLTKRDEKSAGPATAEASTPSVPQPAAGEIKKAAASVVTVRRVVNQDTIDCALELKAHGLNPLVLNNASDFHPGGGFLKGSSAQEEECFRRTTYCMSLLTPEVKRKHYPLQGTRCLYSPKVVVFRGSRAERYYIFKWKDCVALSFLAMPALRHPHLLKSVYMQDKPVRDALGHTTVQKVPVTVWQMNATDTQLMLSKIRMIFAVARAHGHDSLVLGALGCGAFGCPPAQVATLFKQVIGEYDGVFREVVFAVLSGGKDSNFTVFKQILSS